MHKIVNLFMSQIVIKYFIGVYVVIIVFYKWNLANSLWICIVECPYSRRINFQDMILANN